MLSLASRFNKTVCFVLLSLCLLGCIPALFGLFVKKELKNIVATLELPGGAILSMENYHQGWLRSNATFKIVQPLEQPHTLHYFNADDIAVKIHVQITHGPIMPRGLKSDFGLARLAFSTTIDDIAGLDPNVQTEIADLVGKRDLLAAQAVIEFTGDFTLLFATTPFNQTKNDNKLTWNGLKGKFSVDANVSQAQADITVTPLLFSTNKGESLNISALNFNASVKRKSDYPWIGTQNITLSQFYAKDFLNNELRFSNLNIALKSVMEHDFVNATFNAAADNIRIAAQDIEQINIAAKLNKLSAKPLFQLQKLLHFNPPLDDEQAITLVDAALETLSLGAHGTLQYQINTADGKIVTNVTMQFPNLANEQSVDLSKSPALTLNKLLTELEIKMSFWAPKSLLKNLLIKKNMAQWSAANISASNELIKAQNTQIENTINMQLLDLEKNQFFILENNVYHLDILYKQGKMTLNGHLIPEQELAVFLLLLLQP